MTQISQELVDRCVAFVLAEAARGTGVFCNNEQNAIAKGIASWLPKPVDPDLIEARRIASEIYADAEYMGGDFDRSDRVRGLLSAIKLGRSLALSQQGEG